MLHLCAQSTFSCFETDPTYHSPPGSEVLQIVPTGRSIDMASSSSLKPAILLVQGVCHTVACFDDIKKRFEALSYDVFCTELPSVGDASKSHTDDRDALYQLIEPQLDQGREFVVLAHSYGSIPGAAACENQTVQERKAAGKKGGIRLLIMVSCGAVVKKGQTMLGEAGGAYPPYLMPKDDDKTVCSSPNSSRRPMEC
jgi:pimeloyl-ACP methyl ester carboxylesterase